MSYRDLRDFMTLLEQHGDLVRIPQQVDWDLEVGAVSRRTFEQSGPALWFQHVKDVPEGFSILNRPVGTWRRVALALDMPPESGVREIYRTYEERIGREGILPVEVSREEAPCKQHRMTGGDVDLYKLPAPMIHEGDGGRYLGTWDLVVTEDPDTGWANWGMYRFMVHNRNTLAGWPQATSQLALMMREKYLPQQQSMPVAIVIGADPLSHMVASAPVRPGISEADVAGALRGSPIALVRCETSHLMVPAQAEIVIEGEILWNRVVPDGPFGEYPGYRSGTMAEGVGLQVTAITYRDNPILTMTALGVPPDDSSIAASLTAAVGIKQGLKRRGLPVLDVYVPPEGVTHLVVVSVAQGGVEVTKQVLEFFTARRVMVSKIIVVDPDVDVFDMGQVLHAFATKCHPERGILVNHYEGRGNALTPYYSSEERRVLRGASVAFDATWPPSWPEETVPVKASFEQTFSSPVKDLVRSRWAEYGDGALAERFR